MAKKAEEKKHQPPSAPKRKATDTSSVGGMMTSDVCKTDGTADGVERLTRRQLDEVLARPESYLEARKAMGL